MKIVVTDGFAVNPGDLSWDYLKKYGEVAVYDKEGHLLAVYGPDGNGQLKSIRGLWS